MTVGQILKQARHEKKINRDQESWIVMMLNKHIRHHGPHAVVNYLEESLRPRVRGQQH